jgi:miniconductance mechanosensitive channel
MYKFIEMYLTSCEMVWLQPIYLIFNIVILCLLAYFIYVVFRLVLVTVVLFIKRKTQFDDLLVTNKTAKYIP